MLNSRIARKVSILLVTLAGAMLQDAAAGASESGAGPYHSAGIFESVTPDATGLGSVEAEASADRLDGRMSTDAVVTSDSAVGVIIPAYLGPWGPSAGIGGVWSYAWGEVRHSVPVSVGEHKVAATFGSVTSSYSSYPKGSDHLGHTSPLTASASSLVQLHSVVSYFPCQAGCGPAYSERIVLDLKDGDSGSFTLTSSSFSVATPGRVEVRVAVVGWATARGKNASATAAGSGNLAGIAIL